MARPRTNEPAVPPAALSGAFRPLLPAAVEVVDSFAIAASALHPDEERVIEGTRAQRREQFAAGRTCAREALRALGVEQFALLPAQDRSPIWPAGITGSITHAGGFCAAAVARQEHIAAVGIDTEQVDRFAERLWPRICTDHELEWVYDQPEGERVARVATVFSAKEAAYKCQYQMTRRWIALGSAEIDLEGDRFAVRFLPAADVDEMLRIPIHGRFAMHDGFVLSAALAERR